MSDWRGPEIEAKLLALVTQRMQLCTVFLQGEVRKDINVGNADGKNPSLPGEPPHKVTGRLFRSIATSVVASSQAVLGLVGTNVKYARRLEYGFVGTDAKGRTVHQEPRPFLRPAIPKNRARLNSIFLTGR